MFESISTWVIALPVGAILGWIANRLLGPTADAMGTGLLDVLSRWWNKKSEAIIIYQKLEDLVRENHKTNGHNRFNERKTYLHDREINILLAKYGRFMRRTIKEMWIDSALINNYDESDIFFAGMNLFFSQLGKGDISRIFTKFKDNNQAALGWWLAQVEERNPKLISCDVLKYLRAEQDKWSK
jgi:hypothetical protein